MTQRRQHILEQLDAAGERTEAFFAALTPDQLQYPVYSDGARWSVRQVLAHLATIEK